MIIKRILRHMGLFDSDLNRWKGFLGWLSYKKIKIRWFRRYGNTALKKYIINILEKLELSNYDIIIIGYNTLTKELIRQLDRKGYCIKSLYADSDEIGFENVKHDLSAILLEDIEKSYIFVTTYNNIYKKVSNLIDWGFSLDNISICDINKRRGTLGKECYDVLLGYTREDDENGFTIFGNKNSRNIIVTLGGSTTDATCSGLMSWSELLYNKFNKIYGDDIAVWCAGMGSFMSSTELFKLIRDVLPIRPIMVISYSGFNDIYYEYINYTIKGDRFQYGYQFSFLQAALEKGIINSYNPIIEVKKITAGNNCNYRTVAEQWVENEITMNAICGAHGISFFAFFQPCFWYGEGKNGNSGEKILFFMDKYNDIKEIINDEKYYYIEDLSDIFDDEKNIYTDECHVYERGNRIICEYIFRRINSELRKRII